MKIATATEISDNAKTGRVSATYAAQASCPTTCPFLRNGCYAELGASFAGFTTNRLNKAAAADGARALEVAKAEAAAIATLSGKRPLRLHVVGDCRTDA